MNPLTLLLAIRLMCFPDACPHPAYPQISVQERWAYIVTGESSGGWPEGSLLVAWTLRSWQVYRGMPAEAAGPRWGWHGWKAPTWEAEQAVRSVWNQPMSNSPFAFMRDGNWCQALGSLQDGRLWKSLGWWDEPNFVLPYAPGSTYQMNCYWH